MESNRLKETLLELDAWRRLSQPASGQHLIHQIGEALYRLQGWQWYALAECDGKTVRVRVLSEAGKPKANLSYPLEESPCRQLYHDSHDIGLMIYCNNVKRFPYWTLLQHLPVRSYLGMRLADTVDHRQYHLFALHSQLVEESALPRSLFTSACARVLNDLKHRQQRSDLMQLQQVTECPSLSLALVDKEFRLRWASPGFSANLGSPVDGMLSLPIQQLFSKLDAHAFSLCQSYPISVTHPWQDEEGNPEYLQLKLSQVSDGYVIQLAKQGAQMATLAHQPNHLASRLEQELARLQRKGEVAALVFVDFRAGINAMHSHEHWQEFAIDQIASTVRKEDFVATLDRQVVLLTACFDNHGEVPRTQLTAITDKIDRVLSQNQIPSGFQGEHQIKIRLITSWDSDIDHLLSADNATDWRGKTANNGEVAIT